MKKTSTNDEKRISKFLSIQIKTLSIFLLCFFNFYTAQNISNENVIHLNNGVQIIAENSAEKEVKNQIYVTAGTSVSDFSESNLEIVKIKDAKKHIAANIKSAPRLKQKNVKAEPVKQKVANTLPKEEETFTSGSESDYIFSIEQNHSNAVAQTRNPVLKNLLTAGFSSLQTLTLLDSVQTIMPDYLTYFNDKINSESYSVRPPPIRL
jgi:hypothetical protein